MKKVKYQPNTEDSFMADDLLPCPFCGGKAELIFIGNHATKSKKVEIKCSGKCRCRMVNGVPKNYRSAEWIANLSIELWNTRRSI